MIRPLIFAPFASLAAGMSTRAGGVSTGPYASMNLDNRGPDEEALRDENRRRFCAELGFGPESLARSLQVHGTEILEAHAGGFHEGYDALVTNKVNVLVAVGIADCTPILIYDAKNQAVAAIHAGWKGTARQIVSKTIQKMTTLYGTHGTDCHAFIGACIDECSFEVGEEVAAQFSDLHKRWDADRGKFFVDLKQANAAQLLVAGVPKIQMEISPLSTVLNNDLFFSHRHNQGVTGRMLAGIGLKPI